MKTLCKLLFVAMLLVSVLGTVTVPAIAADSDNYVAAHWKFQNEEGNYSGSIEDDDFRIIDLTGNGNDLEVRSEGNGDELDIFEWDDGATVGEDGGYTSSSSLRFGNTWDQALSVDPYPSEQTSYSGAYVSGKYLQTVDGAPLNSVDSTTGWTVEIVFKIDEEWNTNYNRYTGLFSRQGVIESQDEPAFSMAITELITGSSDGYIGTDGRTGLQYVHVDMNESKTNHEFMNDQIYAEQWIHYMVTSDGEWLDVYINGENVLSMAENNEILITDTLFSWEVGVGRKTGFNKDTNSNHATMNPKHPEGLIRRLFCGSISEIRFSMDYMEIEDSLLYVNATEQETEGNEGEKTPLLENNFIYNIWNEDIVLGCFDNASQTAVEATEEGVKLSGIASEGVDPFVTFKINNYQSAVNADAFKAEEYPYVVFKIKSEGTNEECQLFYTSSPSEENSERGYYTADGEWQYMLFDLSYCDGWLSQRKLTTVRFDWATGYTGDAEAAYMTIGEIAFFKTEEEANAYAGIVPETEPEKTEAPETEAPETQAPATEAPAETNAPVESGCGSGIGFGAAAVLAAGAAFVVLKKKD